MDHETAVMVIINAMQSDQRQEDTDKEVQEFLTTVDPNDRAAVLNEATEKFNRLKAGLPIE